MQILNHPPTSTTHLFRQAKRQPSGCLCLQRRMGVSYTPRAAPPSARHFRRTTSHRCHPPTASVTSPRIDQADRLSIAKEAAQGDAAARESLPLLHFLGVQGLAPETRGMERGRRLTAPSPAERPKRLHGFRFHAAGGKPARPKRRSLFPAARRSQRSVTLPAARRSQRSVTLPAARRSQRSVTKLASPPSTHTYPCGQARSGATTPTSAPPANGCPRSAAGLHAQSTAPHGP